MNMRIVQMLAVIVIVGLSIFFISQHNGTENVNLTGDSGISEENASTIILKNQGGDMGGHTPRGFQGMGTGLFVGDNLNSGS